MFFDQYWLQRLVFYAILNKKTDRYIGRKDEKE